MSNELINDWRPETKSFVLRLIAGGFVILKGYNGEETENFECVGKLTRAKLNEAVDKLVKCLIATDEAMIYVSHPRYSFSSASFLLILGNSPGELVSDWTWKRDASQEYERLLDAVCHEHSQEWERKGQAKATRAEIYG